MEAAFFLIYALSLMVSDHHLIDTCTITIDPLRTIAPVDSRIYSGFVEHLGRCIYGGLVPVPGTPDNRVTPSGFRKDVIELLRDELKVPIVRWPGGNFVSSYQWQDGIGPKENRPKRPELAWGGEESNLFGMDEYIAWCSEAHVEPYICLNMGTGTLTDALAWLEYANGTKDTYWANLRRKHTGKQEAYGVNLWGLGNEMWGEWQVNNLTASEYAAKAARWAHALKLLDPTISLISCGETGASSWDYEVLQKLAKWVDYHSIHRYSNLDVNGEFDGQDDEYERNVFGPAAAEHSIDIAKSLIDLARIEQKVSKPIKIAFDEWNVWDIKKGTPQNGLEQHYTLTDALALASWLNIFIRKSDIVSIACIAQSVNVISPILTSPTGYLLQSTFWPLHLFSNYMRDGEALSVHLSGNIPHFTSSSGPLNPKWIETLHPKESLSYLDASAVLCQGRSVRLAVVNRHRTLALSATLNLCGFKAPEKVVRFEVWSEDVAATNTWENGDEVQLTSATVDWEDAFTFKEHSFTLLKFDVSPSN